MNYVYLEAFPGILNVIYLCMFYLGSEDIIYKLVLYYVCAWYYLLQTNPLYAIQNIG